MPRKYTRKQPQLFFDGTRFATDIVRAGWSNKEAARKAGISHRCLLYILEGRHGRNETRILLAKALARKFGRSVDAAAGHYLVTPPDEAR